MPKETGASPFCFMKRWFLFSIATAFALVVYAQPRFRVMTWNVENLFDCRHDTLKQDEEFMPESERQWTWGRYWRKIEDISRVIMGIGEDMPPVLVGLCEVENDSVMIALTRRGPMRELHYEYVMTDSPDLRGVDVALMYQPTMFRLLGHESRRVPSQKYGYKPTRDLLHAWGLMPNNDTLHVVLCHLPSRAGDSRESEKNRRLAVSTLKDLADSLLMCNPQCKLIVMGDFNATLRDKSMKPLVAQGFLKPLTPDKRRPLSGTYRYKGDWSWIDHMLVSDGLLMMHSEKKPIVKLYTQPWMQRPMNDGTWYPRRTYLGTTYNGGVSDHVPIYCDLKW